MMPIRSEETYIRCAQQLTAATFRPCGTYLSAFQILGESPRLGFGTGAESLSAYSWKTYRTKLLETSRLFLRVTRGALLGRASHF